MSRKRKNNFNGVNALFQGFSLTKNESCATNNISKVAADEAYCQDADGITTTLSLYVLYLQNRAHAFIGQQICR